MLILSPVRRHQSLFPAASPPINTLTQVLPLTPPSSPSFPPRRSLQIASYSAFPPTAYRVFGFRCLTLSFVGMPPYGQVELVVRLFNMKVGIFSPI